MATTAAATTPLEELWARYRSVLGRQRMTPNAAQWHEKWARHFVWNRDRAALDALSAQQVGASGSGAKPGPGGRKFPCTSGTRVRGQARSYGP